MHCELFWTSAQKNGVLKTVPKIYDKYLWGSILRNLQVMQLFQKVSPLPVFLKSDHSFSSVYYEHLLFQTILVIVISKNKLKVLKFYVFTQISKLHS